MLTETVSSFKCVSSDFLNEKVLMILTCSILKIKAQLNQLVNWKTSFNKYITNMKLDSRNSLLQIF